MKPFRMRRLDQDDRKHKEKERTGAGVPLAPTPGAGIPALPSGGLGTAEIGSRMAASIGTASPGASSSQLGGLLGFISKSTGLSAVVASKAGIVALTLAAGTVAAGISLIVGNSSSSSRPVLGHKVFDKNVPESSQRTSAAQAAPGSADESDPNGSSLDYVAQANKQNETEADPSSNDAPTPSEPGAKDAPRDVVTATPPENKAAPRPTAEKPKMTPPKANVSIKGASSMQSGVVLQAMADYSAGVNNPFQEVYKPPPSLMDRPTYGANRRSSVVAPMTGSSAWDQAKFTNGMSRRASRMAAGAGSAASAALPFDGGMSLGTTAKTPGGGGASLGGTGTGSSASGDLDVKSVSVAPPQPEGVKNTKNKTPYQGLVYAGVAALMIGQLLVQVASKLVQTNPAAAQAVAAAAMAAGGSAAGIGASIAGQYDQLTQGLPFMMGGAVVAAQAAMVLIKASKADQDTQNGLQNADQAAQQQTNDAMQPPQPPQIPQSGNTDKPKEQPKPQEIIQNNVQKDSPPNYTGQIDAVQ